jgi:predicted DNA-binding protein
MSQTSIERLRDYLAQLPPQAQALLMREFERAIERGEDIAVATFVLEQLRKVVRGADDEARPRTDRSWSRRICRSGRGRSGARR